MPSSGRNMIESNMARQPPTLLKACDTLCMNPSEYHQHLVCKVEVELLEVWSNLLFPFHFVIPKACVLYNKPCLFTHTCHPCHWC